MSSEPDNFPGVGKVMTESSSNSDDNDKSNHWIMKLPRVMVPEEYRIKDTQSLLSKAKQSFFNGHISNAELNEILQQSSREDFIKEFSDSDYMILLNMSDRERLMLRLDYLSHNYGLNGIKLLAYAIIGKHLDVLDWIIDTGYPVLDSRDLSYSDEESIDEAEETLQYHVDDILDIVVKAFKRDNVVFLEKLANILGLFELLDPEIEPDPLSPWALYKANEHNAKKTQQMLEKVYAKGTKPARPIQSITTQSMVK